MKHFINKESAHRFNSLNDYLFYKVMGEKGDEPQLTSFLNAVLSRSGRKPILSLEIQEKKTFVRDLIQGKSCVLDVRAALSDKTKVNIEVQLGNEYNIDRRSLFYWSKLYTEGFKKGCDYRELPDVIAVNIAGFNFPPKGNIHTCFRLREESDTSIILTDALEIHYINMIKWRKCREKDITNNLLHRWLAWLDPKSPPELAEEAAEMDRTIMAASEKQQIVVQDEAARELYEMRQKVQWDWISGLNGARRKGFEKGQLKGEKKRNIEIARNALAKGYSPDMIHDITGLDARTIARLS